MTDDVYTMGFMLFVFVAPGLGAYAFTTWHGARRPGPGSPRVAWLAGTALSIGLWAGLWGVAERMRIWSAHDDRAANMALVSFFACVAANAVAGLLLLVPWRRGSGRWRVERAGSASGAAGEARNGA